MSRIFGLVPNVFFLGLVSLFNDFSAEMIIAVMPAFLVSLGAAPVFIGFLEGFADALASILKIVSGRLSDKLKMRKKISVLGYSLSVFTRWVLFFVTNIWQVFVLRALDRVGKGFRDSPRDALLAESVERREVGKSFGYQRAMDAIGGIFGPLFAVALLPILSGNYRQLFLIAFGIGILGLLSFLPVREMSQPVGANSHTPIKLSLRNFSGQFKRFVSAVFIFGLGAMPISLILLKSISISSSATTIPLMYLFYSVSFAVFAIPFGRFSDRIGERKIILGGFAAAIVSYLILAQQSDFFGIALGYVIFGIYSAMTNGVERAFASKLAPAELQASGQGFLGASTGLSSLLAGLAGGIIWTVYGAAPALYYGAGLMALGFALFAFLNGLEKDV